MAAHAEEEGPLHTASNQRGAAVLDVLLERLDRAAAERDDALLVALAANLGASLVEMEVLFAESDNLAHAQSAGVQEFEDGVIAQGEGGSNRRMAGQVGIARDGGGEIEHVRHFAFGERLGQDLPACRAFDGDGGVVGDALIQQQPAIEAAQAAQLAGDGAGVDVVAAQVRHEAADVRFDSGDQQRVAAL